MVMLNENEVEALFYEKLVDAVGSVPVKVVSTEVIDALPVVVLQWVGSQESQGWGGQGGIVRILTVSYSLNVIGNDRNTVNTIVNDIKDNLLLRGQIVVDAATSIQLIYLRPSDWAYRSRDDDVVEKISFGSLVYTF